jgi:hypothetical protein
LAAAFGSKHCKFAVATAATRELQHLRQTQAFAAAALLLLLAVVITSTGC